VVGERGTQLTMRSIHVGGVVKVGVKKILSDILENDPYIKKEELEKNIDQVDSNLVSLKKCKMILSLEDYDIGDNLSINEEDGFIWVKSLISIMEFENGEKFNIILDYNVEISMVSEVINDKKTITIFFGENDKILEVPLTQEDIKAQVLYLGRLLGGRELFKDVNHLFMKLYKIYGALPGDMDLVHLEVLLSQCLRDKTNPMYPARVGKDPYNPVLVNIKTNVFSTSFVQGLCFENVGKAIKTGLLEDKSMPPSILEKVLTGTLVEKEKKD
jgi:hypothetical protein